MLQPLLRPVAVAANDRLRGASPVVLPAPPALDLDFVGRPSLSYPGLPPLTFSRADAVPCATYRDSAGIRRIAPANVPRFDHDVHGNRLGYLRENGRTNLLLNSTAPVTQKVNIASAGQFYILSCEGSGSVAVTADTASITATGSATEGTPFQFQCNVTGDVDITVTGTVTAFQLELGIGGAHATSLIVTAGTSATRASETCSLSPSPWFRPEEGTMFAEFDPMPTGIVYAGIMLTVNDGTNNNAISLAPGTTGANQGVIRAGNVAQATFTDFTSSFLNGSFHRAAMAWRTNDVQFAGDGVLGTRDIGATIPAATMTTALIGVGLASNTPSTGWVRRLAYWPHRLPDPILQTLTK